MTGFGKAILQTKNKNIQIEIKSLNSKQLDVNIKLPISYKKKEIEIRNLLAGKLIRGKIEMLISEELINDEEEFVNKINSSVIKSYFHQLKKIATDLEIKMDDTFFSNLVRLPDVIQSPMIDISEDEWERLQKSIELAIEDLNLFRKQEGKALEKDIKNRIYQISSLSENIEKYEKKRVETIKERIKNNLFNFLGKENIDENRFEQELIYYLEKIDITEEKVRLKNHCSYFLETINQNKVNGKKLGFITQEIGREINTIGSKANDSDIQKIVILMKDELEKIKEQIFNVL